MDPFTSREEQDAAAEDWLWVESGECEDRSSTSGRSPHTASSEVGEASSPKSESVADMVLAQPLLPRSSASGADPTLAKDVAQAASANATAAAATAPAPAGQHQQQQQPVEGQPQRQPQGELQPQSPPPKPHPHSQHGLSAVASAAVAAASAGLTAYCELAQYAADVARDEWYRLLLWLNRALAHAHTSLQHAGASTALFLEAAAGATCTHLEQAGDAAAAFVDAARLAVGQRLHKTRMLTYQMAKGWQSPSWALLSVGAVTTLSAVAIGSLIWTNHGLSQQLRQRDRELAQLVMRIMHLQESLHSSRAAAPVVRHLMQPGNAGFMVSNLA